MIFLPKLSSDDEVFRVITDISLELSGKIKKEINIIPIYEDFRRPIYLSGDDALKRCAKLFGFEQGDQEDIAKLAIQRNRLAHRYLNFRWQTISIYKNQRNLIQRLLTAILRRERE